MAKASANQNTRSESIDVTDFMQARALLAAWRGVHEIFGGRVDSWEIVPPTSDNPDGGLVAHGFSVNGGKTYTPQQVVDDLSRRDRRVEFLPAYHYVNGVAPEPYTDAQEMSNFTILYMKGSAEEGTSKTPAYVREAIAEYKASHGFATRRGPKRRIIRLDELGKIDSDTLRNVDKDQLRDFLRLAEQIVEATPADADAATVS